MGFQQNIGFYGVPGMTTRHKFEHEFNRLCADKPRYVFILLGGNNISTTTTPVSIFNDLKNIVEELKQCGVKRVFVSSLQPREKFRDTEMTEKTYNKMRKSINEKLRKHLGKDYVDTSKFLIYPRHFDRDGVHPGDINGGSIRLRRVILTAFSKTVLKSVVVKRN